MDSVVYSITLCFSEVQCQLWYICVGYAYDLARRRDRKGRRSMYCLSVSEPVCTELSETNHFTLSVYLTYSKFNLKCLKVSRF